MRVFLFSRRTIITVAFVIFAHVYNMEGKSSIHSGAFFYAYFPIVRAECPDS